MSLKLHMSDMRNKGSGHVSGKYSSKFDGSRRQLGSQDLLYS